MTSAIAVAQAFLDLAKKERRSLTHMQLQKLVFFAHGIHLAAYDGEPLIDDDIRAWDFGPVIPSLYERLRKFGRGEVDPVISARDRDRLDPGSSEMQAIRSVWEAYKDYSAWELSSITHRPGSPWSKVWDRSKYGDIPDRIIRDYYEGRVTHKHGRS
ncbi:Panacea domain-containing protein [Pseudomonas kurunegalensis]|uniref:DUF4065 domain-containing protein n=1 Tax=Pseudomonas kurunegalensis TaxID=485880 RepID=A0ACC5UKJ9_9PSED|nr:type II toxin-antitoxin system antitoxin SocA domain-containing protein [Pseudomonas kurunegalensis]MBV4514936.1 DUF4065 domain-containing protein [Pseudomonas kurunegalensis]